MHTTPDAHLLQPRCSGLALDYLVARRQVKVVPEACVSLLTRVSRVTSRGIVTSQHTLLF